MLRDQEMSVQPHHRSNRRVMERTWGTRESVNLGKRFPCDSEQTIPFTDGRADIRMADSKRQLTIKTGAVRRLSKELVLYEKERDAEVVKVERLKASEADSHDIKHAVGYYCGSGTLVCPCCSTVSSWKYHGITDVILV